MAMGSIVVYAWWRGYGGRLAGWGAVWARGGEGLVYEPCVRARRASAEPSEGRLPGCGRPSSPGLVEALKVQMRVLGVRRRETSTAWEQPAAVLALPA